MTIPVDYFLHDKAKWNSYGNLGLIKTFIKNEQVTVGASHLICFLVCHASIRTGTMQILRDFCEYSNRLNW